MNTRRSVRMAIPALLALLAFAPLSAQSRGDSLTFDRGAVAALLRQWYQAWPEADRRKPLLLFTTSTLACTPCCASAINDAVKIARDADADVNTIVAVATTIPREGLAIRRKFKADKVVEDAGNLLHSVLHADGMLPDMYLVDPQGNVVLYRHDLQHNQIEGRLFQGRGDGAATGRQGVVTPLSSVRLIEDDDDIITEAGSPIIDSEGMLTLLERRQNMLYRFDAATGKLLSAIPADTSITFHFMKPSDDPEYWSDLVAHYQAPVKYDAIVRPAGSDTLSVIATLFTGYDTSIQNGEKHIRWHKGSCLVRLHQGRALSVEPVRAGDYYMTGNPVIANGTIISQCVWEGLADEGITEGKRSDSSFGFLLVDGRSGVGGPVISTDALRDAAGVEQRPGTSGSLCASGNGTIFCLNQGNRFFMKAVVRDGGMRPTFLRVGGTLSEGAFARREPRAVASDERSPGAGDSVFCVSLATDERHLFALLISDRASDRETRLYLQRYDMEGGYAGEMRIGTGGERILSAQILGFDGRGVSILTKHEIGRWSIERLPVADALFGGGR